MSDSYEFATHRPATECVFRHKVRQIEAGHVEDRGWKSTATLFFPRLLQNTRRIKSRRRPRHGVSGVNSID